MATLIARLKSILHDRKLLYTLLITIGVFTFVYFLFPQSLLFNYKYDIGKVWTYESLISPYQIDVLYSDEQLLKNEQKLRAELPMKLEEVSVEKKGDLYQLLDALPTIEVGEDSVEIAEHRLIIISVIARFLDRNIVISDTLAYAQSYQLLTNEGVQLRLGRENVYSEQEAQGQIITLIRENGGIDKPALFEIQKLEFSRYQPSVAYRKSLDSILDNQKKIEYTIAQGESIIDKGQKIDQTEMRRLDAYKASKSSNPLEGTALWQIRLGHLMLGGLLFVLMAVYLSIYYPKTIYNFKEVLFLGIWVIGFTYLIYIIDRTQIVNVYILPLAICVLVLRVLYTGHLAFVFYCFLILLCMLVGDLNLQFLMVQLAMGWTAFLSPILTKSWNKFFTAIVLIISSALVVFLSFQLMRGQSDHLTQWSNLSWFGIQALLLLLAAPMIPLSERLFGYVSEVKLQELTNLNQPLLKRLAGEASGTLQHSLNVSILAENAALAINAESLLIKVGALYHDIGKLVNSTYFIENQSHPSPHEDGNEIASAKIIIGHVTEGIRIAKEERLPKAIIDFIATHHGNDRVEFFYQKYQKRTQGMFDDEKVFRYKGPLPQTREQGVLMLADSIEAASKSIKEINEEKIIALVDHIIESKIEKGLLSTCVLSLADIEVCKSVFVKTLMSMHHVRITYPNQKVS